MSIFKMKVKPREVSTYVGTYYGHRSGSKYKVVRVKSGRIWLAWVDSNGDIDLDDEQTAFTIQEWSNYLSAGTYFSVTDNVITQQLKDFKLD